MDWKKAISKFRWGKGGTNRDKLGPEKWAVLLVCGILLLLLAIPAGRKQSAAQTAEAAAAGTEEAGTGAASGEGEDAVEGHMKRKIPERFRLSDCPGSGMISLTASLPMKSKGGTGERDP